MEAPKCKLCGTRHFGLCAIVRRENNPMPRDGRSSSDEHQRKAQSGGLEEKLGKPEALVSFASTSTSPDWRKGYNAYMRDYMRKKRAKDKAK